METVGHSDSRDEVAGERDAELEERVETRREAASSSSWAISRTIYLLTGFGVIGLVFSWLQFSTGSICCGDYDGYYHVGWSQMLWEGIRTGRFPPAFTQLPLTTLNAQDYVDHHFLFHILQIPFTWFRDPVFGAKVGTTLFATLAVFSCYWLLIRYRISYPFAWLIALLASSTPFLFRMNMAKAMSVSIVLLIIGIYLLFERKYTWLILLAFIFALTYDMFALLWLASFVWIVVTLWSEPDRRSKPVRWAIGGALFVILGTILGFVINPYFPHNVQLFVQHLGMKVTGKGFSTAVGGEWYPYDSWEFFKNCAVAFLAMITGYIAFHGRDRKLSAQALFFLIFSTILLLANARWKRFSEYWPPFAVLFAAFALQPLFDGVRAEVGRLPDDVLDELRPFLDRHESPATLAQKRRARWKEVFVVGVVVILLIFQMTANIVTTARDIAGSSEPDYYRKAMEWVRANVPTGEIIFNTDWDDFPRLFYFAPQHRYVSGLDPTYLLDKDAHLSRLYEGITTGRETNPAPLIREHFQSRYVFTDKQEAHDAFFDRAMDSGWFEEVYDDEHCTILRIRDEWQEPPPTETEAPGEMSDPEEPNQASDEEATNETDAP